ncbi:MAG: hypothetical protein Q4C95_10710 [Planctomycetia bacterium]|nr:hypothetical protein [Planctomycetia bacterium]
MNTFLKKEPLFWFIALGVSLCFFCSEPLAFSKDSEEYDFTDPENRWVIIVDTLKYNKSEEINNRDAYGDLYQVLLRTGFKPDNIITYSESAPVTPDFRPTSENIKKLLQTIQSPDYSELRTRNREARIRNINGKAAELHFYIIAQGVTNKAGNRFMIIPSDIDPESIESTEDEGLISINDIQDSLLSTTGDQKPIERTFLIINCISVRSYTRGQKTNPSVDNISVQQLGKHLGTPKSRGSNGSNNAKTYAFWRILIQNQNIADKSPDNFYQTFQNGLAGYADIAGNRDNIVSASELAAYMKKCGKESQMNIINNGNDPFLLGKTEVQPSIPQGLFKKLGDLYTHDKMKDQRKSAYDREQRIQKGKTK